MFRRLPSLRWVAVDGRCPNFIGTTQTLRLPLPRPAPASFPSPGLYHGCLIASLPRGRRCQRRGARTFVGGGRPRTAFSPVEDRGSPKFPHRPPLPPRSCSRDPGRTRRNLPCRSARLGHGYRNARDFFDYTFEAQLHGLMACCLRFKAPGRPGTMQDSLPIARLRSIGWVSHPQGLL